MVELNNEQDKKNKGKHHEKCFEDMSNEVLYEIFDYIDIYHVYETFSNLNSRFHHLIINSSIPLRINLPFTCKSIFQYRCNHIIKPNLHRIVSLRLPNYLTNKFFFTLFTIDASFTRLESLIIDNFHIDHIVQLLTSLMNLPRLYSLSLSADVYSEPLQDVGHFYRLIFRLPVLKYGRFSFATFTIDHNLSIPINNQQEYSPIEYLIIKNPCSIHAFNAILSYTPRLHYFSCDYLSPANDIQTEILISPFYLTHLSITVCFSSFDEFQLFIIKLGSKLKLLRIHTSSSITFLYANRWKWLITNYMKYLSVFDFKHSMSIKKSEHMQVYHALIKQFTSSFWIERQWFFAHQYYTPHRPVKFYSIQPYRRKEYDIFQYSNTELCSCCESGLNLAYEISIDGDYTYPNCLIQFVRARKLSLWSYNHENKDQFITNLINSIPLTQIQELSISFSDISIDLLIELLYCLPNLESLDLNGYLLNHINTQSIQLSTQIDHLMSKNKITKMIISNMDNIMLDDLQFLVNLCPRLQHLEIDFQEGVLEYIAQIVLLKVRNNSSHLFSLLIWDIDQVLVDQFRTMIGNDFIFEYINKNLYLWWS